jgi:hypothetical protein
LRAALFSSGQNGNADAGDNDSMKENILDLVMLLATWLASICPPTGFSDADRPSRASEPLRIGQSTRLEVTRSRPMSQTARPENAPVLGPIVSSAILMTVCGPSADWNTGRRIWEQVLPDVWAGCRMVRGPLGRRGCPGCRICSEGRPVHVRRVRGDRLSRVITEERAPAWWRAPGPGRRRSRWRRAR